MKNVLQDDPIEEIRELQHRISERVGHDPARLVSYYMKLQQQYADRLIIAAKSDLTLESSEPRIESS